MGTEVGQLGGYGLQRANSRAAHILRRIAKSILSSLTRYLHTHIPSTLELKVLFELVQTSYARFCGVRICPTVFGPMRYFIGVALTPTGPMPAAIPRAPPPHLSLSPLSRQLLSLLSHVTCRSITIFGDDRAPDLGSRPCIQHCQWRESPLSVCESRATQTPARQGISPEGPGSRRTRDFMPHFTKNTARIDVRSQPAQVPLLLVLYGAMERLIGLRA
jgi:hypothetical protein